VLQGEAPEVGVAHRREALERPQRHAALAHQRRHVGPRAVGALRRGGRAVVDRGVDDLEARVGDPDLVHVGVREHDAGCGAGLVAAVELAADVPAGPRDPHEEIV
jgi:hypothetical protein